MADRASLEKSLRQQGLSEDEVQSRLSKYDSLQSASASASSASNASADYRHSIGGFFDDLLSGGQGAKSIDDAARAAADLKDSQAATKLLWASTAANVDKQLYGDGTPGSGILNQFAQMKSDQIAAGVANKSEVMKMFSDFSAKYTPFYQSLVDSASQAAAQLHDLAGSDLGTSKAYLSQLALGTRQLNARLSSQGLLNSTAGNNKFADFVMQLGGQEETRRENLLGGIVNTGLQGAQGLAQTGQFGANMANNINTNNIDNATAMGTNQAQFGLSGAQLAANTNLGIGSQQLGSQGFLYGQINSSLNRADNIDSQNGNFVGGLAKTGLQLYGAANGIPVVK